LLSSLIPFQLEVKALQEKYEMIAKRAIMDILKQAARDDDDAATVTEVRLFYSSWLDNLTN
jgi:hypothetical protein